MNRYRITRVDGTVERIETNECGIVSYAEGGCRRYWGQFLPVARDCLEAEHAMIEPLAFGEVFAPETASMEMW